MSVIQCYAPTNNDKDEEKDEFYETLNGIKSRIPKHDVIVIMGDMNAKMQKQALTTQEWKTSWERTVLGSETTIERELDFCLENNLTVGGTIFKHKDIHTMT